MHEVQVDSNEPGLATPRRRTMTNWTAKPWVAAAWAVLSMWIAAPAQAELSVEELAKLAQNPVGNLITLPFQNNTNFNVGPENGTQKILNIQPVIPVAVNSEWNVITRTIVPLEHGDPWVYGALINNSRCRVASGAAPTTTA
jgi:hypothetical protein